MVVVNDREHRSFDRVGGNTLVFNKNNQRLAYIGRTGRGMTVVVGPLESPSGQKRLRRHERIAYLTFSPDGDRCIYTATSSAQACTVIDEVEAAHRYDSIWSPPERRLIFDNYRKFHYLGVKKDRIYLVEEEMD